MTSIIHILIKYLWYAKHKEAQVPALLEKIHIKQAMTVDGSIGRGLVQDTGCGIGSTWIRAPILWLLSCVLNKLDNCSKLQFLLLGNMNTKVHL